MRVIFLYWGRRGLSRFVLELSQSAMKSDGLDSMLSVSVQNERFLDFVGLGIAMVPVSTFGSTLELLTAIWRLPQALHALQQAIRAQSNEVVIDLMPHLWSPLVARMVKASGSRYVVIAHDADAHPGDWTARIKSILDLSIKQADGVVCLSAAVARRVVERGWVAPSAVTTLFHPDLTFSPSTNKRQLPSPGTPIALLFLGRIMPYKGLGLFLDSVERLRARGRLVQPLIYGEGPLGEDATRAARMGAEIVNRWLSDDEIATALARSHILVASHIEASQSGTVASALGAGLPVVVTPVGGLAEQIVNGQTGIVARQLDAEAIADAVEAVAADAEIYGQFLENIEVHRSTRSVDSFLRRLLAAVQPDANNSA